MTIRYIVRPPNINTTPRKLKEVLNAERTVNPRISNRTLSWVDDLFLYYPNLPHEVAEYQVVREFFRATKSGQRGLLAVAGVMVPESHPWNDNTMFVVRPHRHSGGNDFRVMTLTEINETINTDTHWYSPLFPKVKEYRVIFVKGVPIITLRKVFPLSQSIVGAPQLPSFDVPWNHAQGASFITVQRGHTASSLRHSNAVADLLNVPVVQHAHIVAADIMLNRANEYAVCELNFCPAITIPDNLEKIKSTLLGE